MSKAEIAHRIGETIKRRIDRRKADPSSRHDRGSLSEIPGLRNGIKNWDVPHALLHEWRDDAAQSQTGNFYLLGQAWPKSSTTDKWHLDPVSGKFWPKDRYCFDIDFRHAKEMGDIKHVWELNRLQYLQPVAALACKRADSALAYYCIDEIIGWIDQNPPHLGVNWASGIELALRAVSILVVTTLVGEYLTPEQRGKIWSTLEMHGAWLERYPSRYSSANNHLAAEGLGLFIVGTLCPLLPDATRWRTHGWEILCDVAQEQIYPDGVGVEQTITYTAVVLEMLLLGQHIARATHIDVPEGYSDRIMKSGMYLRWFTDSAGNHPYIGDNDNARVLGVYRRDESYVRSILGCIAAATNRPDLTPPHLKPHFRQAIFGLAPAPEPEPVGVKNFADGGYTVGRHKAGNHDVMLAFDHGQLGYLSIAAHGHADALALWLHIDGQPVLVDAGTYLYHSGGAWRTWFRGTSSHNTLCLEDTDSSVMSGNFNWSHKANARLTAYEIGSDYWRAEAEHDGYLKKFGVHHHRTLRVMPQTGFAVADILSGSGTHHVKINFLLHPDLTAHHDGHTVRVMHGSKLILRAVYEGPLSCKICAADAPDGGWYSESFGIKTPAPRLVYEGTLPSGQSSKVTFFFDEERPQTH
ncbi:MAG: alginate lyase family protein [Alphaproteobacteria bacterium]